MTHSINSLQGKLWRNILIIFGIMVVSYGAFRIVPIIRGVSIITTQPEKIIQDDNSITLNGIARHARSLSINGRSILIDPDGSFTEEIMLVSGVNKITLSAEDIRGRIHTKEIILNGNVNENTDLPEIKNLKTDTVEKEIEKIEPDTPVSEVENEDQLETIINN